MNPTTDDAVSGFAISSLRFLSCEGTLVARLICSYSSNRQSTCGRISLFHRISLLSQRYRLGLCRHRSIGSMREVHDRFPLSRWTFPSYDPRYKSCFLTRLKTPTRSRSIIDGTETRFELKFNKRIQDQIVAVNIHRSSTVSPSTDGFHIKRGTRSR